MFQVINDHGRRFNVCIVPEGGAYGLTDSLVANKPMVEFYDATQDRAKFGTRGQFVSRYYIETLRERPAGPAAGLILDGGIAEWRLDGNAMEQVHRHLRAR